MKWRVTLLYDSYGQIQGGGGAGGPGPHFVGGRFLLPP